MTCGFGSVAPRTFFKPGNPSSIPDAGNHLKRRGVATRGRKLTDERIAEAVELYQAGWSLAQIGERFGVYPQSINDRFKRAGVPLRRNHVLNHERELTAEDNPLEPDRLTMIDLLLG
jgi:hypothetical protein